MGPREKWSSFVDKHPIAGRLLRSAWWLYSFAYVVSTCFSLVDTGRLRLSWSMDSDLTAVVFSIGLGMILPLGVSIPLGSDRPTRSQYWLTMLAGWFIWLLLYVWQFFVAVGQRDPLWNLNYGVLKVFFGLFALVGVAIVAFFRYRYARPGDVHWLQLVVWHLVAGVTPVAMLWRSDQGLPPGASLFVYGVVAALFYAVRGPIQGVLAGGLWVGAVALMLPWGTKWMRWIDPSTALWHVAPYIIAGAVVGAFLRIAAERLTREQRT